MRWSGALLVLVACAEAPSGETWALTYNVAGLPEGISDSHPSVNHPLIGPLLSDYDLVLVQEDFAYHAQLTREVEHAQQSEPGPVLSLVNDGLNRFSNSPFGDLVRERWSACFGSADTSDGGSGDCLASKGFSVATHELAEGVSVDVYNLHVEAGSTARDQELQGEDFAQLREFIETHSDGRAVIVGGDTNLRPDRDPEDAEILDDFLAATGLEDACRHLACGEDERIDRFMYRASAQVVVDPVSWRVESDVFQDADGEPLSDHDPVAVRFVWRAID